MPFLTLSLKLILPDLVNFHFCFSFCLDSNLTFSYIQHLSLIHISTSCSRISSTLMVFGFSWVIRIISGWFPLSACRQERHFPQGFSPSPSHCRSSAKRPVSYTHLPFLSQHPGRKGITRPGTQPVRLQYDPGRRRSLRAFRAG